MISFSLSKDFCNRLLTSFFLIFLVFLLLSYGNLFTKQSFVLLVFAILIYEWINIFFKIFSLSKASKTFFIAFHYLLLAFSFYYHNSSSLLYYALLTSCFFWLLNFMLVFLFQVRSNHIKKYFFSSKILLTLFGILFIYPACLAFLYLFKYDYLHKQNLMLKHLLAVIMITICCDSFAYFFGKKFGKNNVFSKVSPKKTLEGFLGGICCTPIVVGAYLLFIDYFSFGFFLLLIFFSCLSVVGDLSESILKRVAGVKDSGSLLPGHGGFLDRFDSVIAVLPVYFFVNFYYLL